MGFQFSEFQNVCIAILLFMLTMKSSLSVEVTAKKMRGNETDKLSLLAFKAQITADPYQTTSSWNESFHFCQWQGVTCGRRHQRVVQLDLESRGLRGQISPSIANLSFLRGIYLGNNTFHGEIPRDIGRLYRLFALSLELNSLVGQIPASLSLCSNMRIISLDSNNLTGKIPPELGLLSELIHFSASSNELQGNIPPDFGNISSLQELNLVENRIEGSIPESLGKLQNLASLQLSTNKLSGKIPLTIFNLSNLAYFVVADNKLEGELPQDIGLTLPNIELFGVVNNLLSGRIPASIANASNLSILELSNNSFSGGVPGMFGNLKSLSELRMSFTNLGSGNAKDLDFIASLTNCSDLSAIGLTGSNFGGTFPSSIFNLSSKLNSLLMGKNKVSGNIPPGIENLISLTILTLGENRLSGTIPEAIGTLEQLRVLGLNDNRFSGKIPSSLGNLKLLLELSLEQNSLEGPIPSRLGNCTNLELLDLSSNALNGTIPRSVVELPFLSIFLDLSRNRLSGSLPYEVGNLKSLDWLDISYNNLSGVIPTSLGECTMLRLLFMDDNRFEGTIPESFGSLLNIEAIHLSYNNLSGEIPTNMAVLAFLRELDLSFNDLEGELPIGGVFNNKSMISVSGNQKLCGGTPQLGLKACSKKKLRKHSSFHRGKMLIIFIVLSILAVSLILYVLFRRWFKKKRKHQIQASLADPFASVSYGELLKATNGFSAENLIGEGSIGSVYKGILEADQTAVAVKVFNLEKRGASKSFASECETLRGVRHRNLVKIITACSSIDYQGNEFKALVYELMPNGNLEGLLHPNLQPENISPLPLSKRIEIAIDVASAVDYLHNNVETPIVHCDIKPSNILLDQENNAHVGDFGLSRIIPQDNAEISINQTSSSGLKGTIGYAAPEYGMGSKVSKEGDMYSFGVLLLEMFTGKRPTDSDFGDGMNLNHFVKMALPDRVMEIVDQSVIPTEDNQATSNDSQGQAREMKMRECCVSVLKIGVMCSDELPRARMKIDEALKELYAAKKIHASLTEELSRT